MDQSQFAFHLEEYKSLKQELLATIRDSYQAALLSIAGNAALISFWLNNPGAVERFAAAKLLIPMISIAICAFGFSFYRLRRRSLGMIVSYLKLLEQEMRAPALGWESFYQSDIEKRFFFIRTPFVMYSLFVAHLVLVAMFTLTLTFS